MNKIEINESKIVEFQPLNKDTTQSLKYIGKYIYIEDEKIPM